MPTFRPISNAAKRVNPGPVGVVADRRLPITQIRSNDEELGYEA